MVPVGAGVVEDLDDVCFDAGTPKKQHTQEKKGNPAFSLSPDPTGHRHHSPGDGDADGRELVGPHVHLHPEVDVLTLVYPHQPENKYRVATHTVVASKTDTVSTTS